MSPARGSLRTTLTAGVLAAAVVPVWAGPAAADHPAPCSVGELPDSERLADTHTKDNPAFDRMHVEQAQEVATGRGVKVAVIDSGVQDVEGLDVYAGLAIPGVSPNILLSGHGTIVAGLIAGPRGVAPDAQVFDVKVFDSEDADTAQGERALTSAGIVAGIEAVIAANRQQKFDVVNISLAVPQSDPALEAAIARLVELPLVVVAASGNKDDSGDADDPSFKGTPGNDADVFPADYPGVVAVSATPPGDEDPSTYVVPNMDTDVAAPTAGAISANASGQVCVVGEIATSWAAAEVSGILALLSEHVPPRDAAAARRAAPGHHRGSRRTAGPRRGGREPVDRRGRRAGPRRPHPADQARSRGQDRDDRGRDADRRPGAPGAAEARPGEHAARHPPVVGPGRRVAAGARLHAPSAGATLTGGPTPFA